MKISLQPALLLHQKAFRENSRIYDFFTLDHGRVSVVAKGIWRKEKGGSPANLIRPFNRLLISFWGNSELKTLTSVDLDGRPRTLQGEQVVCGFYINELIYKLTEKNDPHPKIFSSAEDALSGFSYGIPNEVVLRSFELIILKELGYEIDLKKDSSGIAIDESSYYAYQPNMGFTKIHSDGKENEVVYRGKDILLIGKGDLHKVLPASKILLRQTLHYHLGDNQIQSRNLFSLPSDRTRSEKL